MLPTSIPVDERKKERRFMILRLNLPLVYLRSTEANNRRSF
jgi:hypothetical protein